MSTFKSDINISYMLLHYAITEMIIIVSIHTGSLTYVIPTWRDRSLNG